MSTDNDPEIPVTVVPTPQNDPVEPDIPPLPPKPTLVELCLAIRDYEGRPGDRNYRNNNPGNCRYSSVGYFSIYGPVKKDKDNFAVFKDWDTGWLYLQNLVRYKIHAFPNRTLLEFMQNYAPSSDGNNPKTYATYIAKRLKVDNSFLMKDLVLS